MIRGRRQLVFWICFGQFGALFPLSTVAARLPEFSTLWGLTNTEAGFLAAATSIGYMLTVPFLVSLTDRIDARLIFGWSGLIAAVAAIGFGLWADGLWSGLFWRTVGGGGLAASYMPGLRALTDRIEDGEPSRAIATYTASYSIGVGLSYLYAGIAGDYFGWRTMSVLGAVGPLVPVFMSFFLLEPKPPPIIDRRPSFLPDFRPVLRNRAAIGYILSYAAHSYELAAARVWTVAFLTFVLSHHPDAPAFLSPAALTTILTMIGLPASIMGNEYAIRFGRRRSLTFIMVLSAIVAAIIGTVSTGPLWLPLLLLLIYAVTLTADSGALTAGTIAVAAADAKGTTMALHSLIGFAISSMAPLVFGLMLDLGGGRMDSIAWTIAFTLNGAVALLGPLALYRFAAR